MNKLLPIIFSLILVISFNGCSSSQTAEEHAAHMEFIGALTEIVLDERKKTTTYSPAKTHTPPKIYTSTKAPSSSNTSISKNSTQDNFVKQDLRPWSPIFSAKKTRKGLPMIRICMRDYACEDGDIIRVDLKHGSGRDFESSITRELTNNNKCSTVSAGPHTSIKVTAVNGTGYKGGCSHENVNTGEVTVQGYNSDGSLQRPQTQRWRLRSAAGTSSFINVRNKQ